MPIMPAALKCSRCGRQYTLTLQSMDGKLPMGELVKIHAAVGLCGKCRREHNWYARTGRSAEFLQMNPLEAIKQNK